MHSFTNPIWAIRSILGTIERDYPREVLEGIVFEESTGLKTKITLKHHCLKNAWVIQESYVD